MNFSCKFVFAVALCLPPSIGSCPSRAEDTPAPATDIVEALKAEAEQGKVGAYLALAGHYFNHKDYANAYLWARKAADQGDAMAEQIIGEFYANGWGVSQNYTEARRWLMRQNMRSPMVSEGRRSRRSRSGRSIHARSDVL
jgi:hypothetical protein